MNEYQLKKAGVSIREHKGQWRVFDGRKIVSRHASYEKAIRAASAVVQMEVY